MNNRLKCKFLYYIIFIILVIPIFVNAEELFPSTEINVSCDGIFTPEALEIIRLVLSWFRILAPITLIILVAVDFANAVINQDNDLLAKAVNKVVKRSLATLGVFFVPTMIIALSKISYIDSILSSDPLCSNATGTIAKESVRVAESKDNVDYTFQNGVINGNYVNNVNGNYTEGPGSNWKRSIKTVTINGRTYDMYNQSYLSDIPYQSGNLAMYGCCPIAFASAVSGFDDSIGAYEAAELVRSRTFGGIERALDSIGIRYDGPYYYNSNDRDEEKIEEMVSLVRDHLAQGKPAIALVTGGNNGENKYATNNHFITLLGETSNGEVIISNCGTEKGNLEEIIRYYLKGGRKGFLLVGWFNEIHRI